VYNLLCWPIRRTSAPGRGRHLESLLRKSTLAVRLTLHHPQLLIAYLLILIARWIPSRQGAIAGGRAKGQGLLAPRLDMISYAVLWTPLDTTFGLIRLNDLNHRRGQFDGFRAPSTCGHPDWTIQSLDGRSVPTSAFASTGAETAAVAAAGDRGWS